MPLLKRIKQKKDIYRKRKPRKKIVLSDPKKWQTALAYLGYYYGPINGDIISFDTHQSIKQFQQSHQYPVSGLLNEEQKSYLFYIYNISAIDKYLNYRGKNKKSNGKKYQAALKVHGVYHDKIDGIMGKGTKKSILEYKEKIGLYSSSSKLTDREKWELVSSAKKLLKMQKRAFQNKENGKKLQTDNNSVTTIPQQNSLQENQLNTDYVESLVPIEENQNHTVEVNDTEQISESTISISDDIANITQEIMQSANK